MVRLIACGAFHNVFFAGRKVRPCRSITKVMTGDVELLLRATKPLRQYFSIRKLNIYVERQEMLVHTPVRTKAAIKAVVSRMQRESQGKND
jgi:hypothetical protein